ncbi:MAG: hypothetical protein ACFN4S_00075 [Prevotella conceptionensis]
MEEVVNQDNRSKRDLLMERLAKKYPDKDFSDDENLFGQISDDYDANDEELNGYKEREGKFADLLNSDPRSASFLVDWKNGKNPLIALIERFGEEDFRDALDDPALREQLSEANQKFVERVAKEKELEEEYNSNITETLAYLDKLQEEDGLSDEEIAEIVQFLANIVKDGIVGKFTPESIEMARKALHHDENVAVASEEGEVRGRNAKIEEKLRKKGAGDGLPHLDGKNGVKEKEHKRPQTIFDEARLAR